MARAVKKKKKMHRLELSVMFLGAATGSPYIVFISTSGM